MLLSGDRVWTCIGDPDEELCIPFVILPSAKHRPLAKVPVAVRTSAGMP